MRRMVDYVAIGDVSTGNPSGTLQISSQHADVPSLVVIGCQKDTQTADLFQLWTSAGSPVMCADCDGNFYTSSWTTPQSSINAGTGFIYAATITATNISGVTKIHATTITGSSVSTVTLTATNISGVTKVDSTWLNATTVTATNISGATTVDATTVKSTTTTASNIYATGITATSVSGLNFLYTNVLTATNISGVTATDSVTVKATTVTATTGTFTNQTLPVVSTETKALKGVFTVTRSLVITGCPTNAAVTATTISVPSTAAMFVTVFATALCTAGTYQASAGVYQKNWLVVGDSSDGTNDLLAVKVAMVDPVSIVASSNALWNVSLVAGVAASNNVAITVISSANTPVIWGLDITTRTISAYGH